MSDIKFSCPACSQHIECDASYGGVQIECPGCKAPMIVPGGAPPLPPGCPGCGKPVGADAVICTECGLNLKTGEKLKAEAPTRVPFVPAKPQRASDGSGIPVWIWAIVGVFALLAVGAWISSGIWVVYEVAVGIFALTVGILVLIDAFKDSVGAGLMTLCLPFYVLYYVYGKCDKPMLKILFTIGIVARGIGFLLGMRYSMSGAE